MFCAAHDNTFRRLVPLWHDCQIPIIARSVSDVYDVQASMKQDPSGDAEGVARTLWLPQVGLDR